MFDLSAHAVNLRSAFCCVTQTLEPFSAVIHYVRHIAKRLNVIHDRWFPPQTADRRKRRLRARCRAFAFEGVEQRGLLSTHVTTCAHMQIHFKTVAGPADVTAQIVIRVRFGERVLESFSRNPVGPAQKYESDVSLDRVRRDDHAFD